jgi:hypothetical protein
MAPIGRRSAMAELPLSIGFGGSLGWLRSLGLHLVLLIDLRNRAVILVKSAWNSLKCDRGNRVIPPTPNDRSEYADCGGDGYVDSERRNTESGLENMCWKDSWNSILFSDGTNLKPPRATRGYSVMSTTRIGGARWCVVRTTASATSGPPWPRGSDPPRSPGREGTWSPAVAGATLDRNSYEMTALVRDRWRRRPSS